MRKPDWLVGRLGFLIVVAAGCGGAGEREEPIVEARCDANSADDQAVVLVVAAGRPVVGAVLLTHDEGGAILGRGATDGHGCGVVVSARAALVTVVFRADGVLLGAVTTRAPSTGVLTIHGPHEAADGPEPLAGRITARVGTVTPLDAMPNDQLYLTYDLGCTRDGCMTGVLDGLPATIDVPARAVRPDGAVVLSLASQLIGYRCCTSNGLPYPISATRSSTGIVVVDGNATVDASFGHSCDCVGPSCEDPACRPGAWRVTMGGFEGSPAAQITAEVEAAGVAWKSVVRNEVPEGESCTPETGWLGTCALIEVPPGIIPERVSLAAVRAQDHPDGTSAFQIGTVRSADPIVALSASELLPAIPSPALFQGADRHAMAWPVAALEADAVVIATELEEQGAQLPWAVVLPADADHVQLPVAPELPVAAYPAAWLVYVDSSELDGFEALARAGLYVDGVGPLVSEQGPIFASRLRLHGSVVPTPAARLRYTGASSLP